MGTDPDTAPLDVIDAIFTTPAVRRVKPDPVSDAIVWDVLDAAIRGPYGGTSQRVAWVVVRDQPTKDVIGTWYRKAWEGMDQTGKRAAVRRLARRVFGPRAWLEPPPLPPQTANDDAGDYLAEHIGRAPVWIFAVVTGIDGEPSLSDGADVFGAVQNLMLAARRHGLGTVLTMLHLQRERDVARMLDLPAGARPLALIPMGYPASGRFATPKRTAVESCTHWDRWGRRRERGDHVDLLPEGN